MSAMGVHAQLGSVCSSGDRTLTVVGGDTLSSIASRSGVSVERLAGYNHIANPNFIYANQTICVPGQGAGGSANNVSVSTARTSGGGYLIAGMPAVGNGNIFPHTGPAHGGLISDITSYMAYLCRGGLTPMPRSGLRALKSSAGVFLALREWEIS
jgi:hypothetical protein